MKKSIKIFCFIIIICILIYASITVVYLKKSNVYELISCSTQPSGYFQLQEIQIQKTCETYLLNLRGNSEDIQDLQSGRPFGFIFSHDTSTETKKNLLTFFIKKGFDINKQDADGFTFMDAAILEGSPQEVQMLIDAGFNLNIKGSKINKTGLEFAEKINSKKHTPETEKIVEILKKASAKNDS